jgi:hypothetical protein
VDDVFMVFTWGSWAASASAEANQPLGDRLARVKEIASCAPPNLSTSRILRKKAMCQMFRDEIGTFWLTKS